MSRAMTIMLSLTVAVPAAAGQYTPNKANPYRGLFAPPPALKALAPATPKEAPKPIVVCGMTMMPADPSIDSKIVMPRKSGGLGYTIRAIDPPICNPAR